MPRLIVSRTLEGDCGGGFYVDLDGESLGNLLAERFVKEITAGRHFF